MYRKLFLLSSLGAVSLIDDPLAVKSGCVHRHKAQCQGRRSQHRRRTYSSGRAGAIARRGVSVRRPNRSSYVTSQKEIRVTHSPL